MYRPFATLGSQRDVTTRRVFAFVVDLALLAVPVAVLTAMGGINRGAAAVLLVAGGLGYFGSMEAIYGQTFGKRLLGVVVTKTDGTPCDGRAAAIRTLARVVDVLPFVYVVDGVARYYVDTNRQRFGDVLADTLVVAVAPATVPDPIETPMARPL